MTAAQDRRAAEEMAAQCFAKTMNRGGFADAIFALVQKAKEKERERCAKIADDETECEDGEIYIARLIARRIRIPSPPESER